MQESGARGAPPSHSHFSHGFEIEESLLSSKRKEAKELDRQQIESRLNATWLHHLSTSLWLPATISGAG